MHFREKLGVSERSACHALGQARAAQRYAARVRGDEDVLADAVVELATFFGRYGYRPPAPEAVLHHRPVPAFTIDGLRPKRASERMANRLT